LSGQRFERETDKGGVNRQDARSAKELEEPGGEVDQIASSALQAAVEVHRVLGPGFFEGVYEEALDVELTLHGIRFVRQPAIGVVYKDRAVNVPVLLRGVRRVVLHSPPSL
jgi:PD-(D/E)XK nuclease superfamily